MKKYRFKRRHNKRKINDKANYTISIKKQKGSTKRLKIYKISLLKRIFFLGKKTSGLIFHKWPDKHNKLVKHIRKSSRRKETLKKQSIRKYISHVLKNIRFLLVEKLRTPFFINGLKKVTNPKFEKIKARKNISFLVRKLQC